MAANPAIKSVVISEPGDLVTVTELELSPEIVAKLEMHGEIPPVVYSVDKSRETSPKKESPVTREGRINLEALFKAELVLMTAYAAGNFAGAALASDLIQLTATFGVISLLFGALTHSLFFSWFKLSGRRG